MDAAIRRAGEPPRGTEVELRGQVRPDARDVPVPGIGLGVAVVVILIMLTAYFQAPRLAVTAVASVPAVLCGVVLALCDHAHDAEYRVVHGGDHGRRRGGLERDHAGQLRRPPPPRGRDAGLTALPSPRPRDGFVPIIMTGCAMIAGMIPMSLGIEEGSEQNAPLGRAVIGGMALATFATLLVLPAVFTLLLGRASSQSPSLDPDDPASAHYDPIPAAHEAPHAEHSPEDSDNGNGDADPDHPSPLKPRT